MRRCDVLGTHRGGLADALDTRGGRYSALLGIGLEWEINIDLVIEQYHDRGRPMPKFALSTGWVEPA